MKKLIMLLLSAIMLIVPVMAYAEVVEIEELNLSIELPQELEITTRDDIDPMFFDVEAAYDYMIENDIYLNVIPWDETFRYELSVFMVDVEGQDSFYTASEKELEKSLPDFAENLQQIGAEIVSSEVMSIGQSKYVVFEMRNIESVGSIYAKQYYTAINEQAISFTMHVFNEADIQEAEELLDAAMQTVQFSKVTTPKRLSNVMRIVIYAVVGAAGGAVLGFSISLINKKRTKREQANQQNNTTDGRLE